MLVLVLVLLLLLLLLGGGGGGSGDGGDGDGGATIDLQRQWLQPFFIHSQPTTKNRTEDILEHFDVELLPPELQAKLGYTPAGAAK
jgi:hypothetical protein